MLVFLRGIVAANSDQANALIYQGMQMTLLHAPTGMVLICPSMHLPKLEPSILLLTPCLRMEMLKLSKTQYAR